MACAWWMPAASTTSPPDTCADRSTSDSTAASPRPAAWSPTSASKIALIAYPGEEQDAALRLARVGSDNAIGYLTVDHDGVFPTELSDLVRTAPRITPAELDGLLAEDAVVLVDIRNQGEVEQGRIPGSVHIPLAQLRARLDLLPTDRLIVVHCAGGWRSSVAASLLRAQGFDNVADLAGGYNAWVDAHAVA